MQFDEIGKSDAKTLLLLPGTACTYQINFSRVIDLLAERYHLICVNYDGFEGDSSKPFTHRSWPQSRQPYFFISTIVKQSH